MAVRVHRDVALRDPRIEPTCRGLVGAEAPREESALVLMTVEPDQHGTRECRLDELHHTTVGTGIGIMNLAPHSRADRSCAMISSLRFHGRIRTYSGRSARMRSGAWIGMRVPGRKRPCFCGFESTV